MPHTKVERRRKESSPSCIINFIFQYNSECGAKRERERRRHFQITIKKRSLFHSRTEKRNLRLLLFSLSHSLTLAPLHQNPFLAFQSQIFLSTNSCRNSHSHRSFIARLIQSYGSKRNMHLLLLFVECNLTQNDVEKKFFFCNLSSSSVFSFSLFSFSDCFLLLFQNADFHSSFYASHSLFCRFIHMQM